MEKGAKMSEDGQYRYSLWRIWDKSKPYVLFIGLNPSDADDKIDDPTLCKCIAYAKKWNFGGLYMANLFAHRDSKPENMFKENDPIGPENDYWIEKLSSNAGRVVVAWGEHGTFQGRGETVLSKLSKPYCLMQLKNGQPGHPLYKDPDLELKLYNPK